MNTKSYFKQYIKRTWWIIASIIVLLVVLFQKQYNEADEGRKVRAFDAAISAGVQIEQLIKNLHQSSENFTKQYAPLIQLAYRDKQAAKNLTLLLKQHLPNVKFLIVTNSEGNTQFGGEIKEPIEQCKNDILLTLGGVEHQTSLHVSDHEKHFDVITKWNIDDQSGAFLIAFDLPLLTDILNFYEPLDHHIYLVDQLDPTKVLIDKSTHQTSKNEVQLSDNDLSNAIFKTPILSTRLMLVSIQNKQSFITYKSQQVFQIIAICALFLSVIFVGLLRLSQQTARTEYVINREQKLKQKDKDMLQSLVQGTSGAIGEAFFYSLVKELSSYLTVDYAFIAVKQRQSEFTYNTLANWVKDHYRTEIDVIQLEHVFDENSFSYINENFEDKFNPLFLNTSIKVSGFLASQLFNNKGEVIGVLAVLSPDSLNLKSNELAVMKIFASRAEAEIDRKNAENELIDEKERAQTSLESIGDGVITTNELGLIDFMNPIAEKLTGWSEELATGIALGSVFHLEDEDTGDVIPDPAIHCIEEKRRVSPKTENVLVSKNTNRYSIKGSASPMFGAYGECIGAVIVFSDVTDSREMERQIVFQASHDALTGLVNRTEFERRLDSAFMSAKEFQHNHVLLYLDLDQFKVVNDTAGHIAGDELLIQVSKLLLEQLRSRDTLGRLGGDEFSVLLEHCPISEAIARAQTLIDAIREFSFIWEKKTYKIGVSIGLVPINKDSLSTVQILTQADLACYTAKDKGRGQAHVFKEDDAEVASRHRELLRAADLNQAIEQHRFELLFQPIISLKGDEIMHGEVLLRLLDENGEHVLPGAFIPAAERYGVMDKIDRWVLAKVFTDYNHIFEQNEHLLMCINLSGNSLSNDDLLPYILELFEKSSIKPSQICFEITETAAINSLSQLNALIKVLKEMGCSFALDDFGSGLSSFNYLKTLKVDYLKIDGHFVSDLCSDEVDRAMVKSINEMGHILDLKTIAECANDEAIVSELKRIGIDYAQGYYLGDLVSMSSLAKNNEEEERALN